MALTPYFLGPSRNLQTRGDVGRMTGVQRGPSQHSPGSVSLAPSGDAIARCAGICKQRQVLGTGTPTPVRAMCPFSRLDAGWLLTGVLGAPGAIPGWGRHPRGPGLGDFSSTRRPRLPQEDSAGTGDGHRCPSCKGVFFAVVPVFLEAEGEGRGRRLSLLQGMGLARGAHLLGAHKVLAVTFTRPQAAGVQGSPRLVLSHHP